MSRTLANTDLRRIKSHTFRLGRYRLEWREPGHKWEGECDDPTTRNKAIFINLDLDEQRLLEVLLDETIHANCWELDNDVVGEMAVSIAAFLRRCGYRRVPLEDKKT